MGSRPQLAGDRQGRSGLPDRPRLAVAEKVSPSIGLCPTLAGNTSLVPKVGMARMTQNIGFIPAVSLLGYTRMCQTTPESGTAGLNWTYHHNQLGSRTCGTPWSASTRPGEAPRQAVVTKRNPAEGTSRDGMCWRPSWPVSLP